MRPQAHIELLAPAMVIRVPLEQTAPLLAGAPGAAGTRRFGYLRKECRECLMR